MLWHRHNKTNFLQIPLQARGRLFVSPMPYGPYDPFNTLMRKYRRHHITRVVILVTDSEIRKKCKRDLFALYTREHIRTLHTPVPDMTAPTHSIIQRLVPKMEAHLQSGGNLAVHCNAGVGRTGVVVSCLIKHLHGVDGDEAIGYVTRNMMIQMTEEQKRFIRSWSAVPRNPDG